MEENVLGDYIKEIHKMKDETLTILADNRDMYKKIISNQDGIAYAKDEIVLAKADIYLARADIEKAKADIAELQKPKATP